MTGINNILSRLKNLDTEIPELRRIPSCEAIDLCVFEDQCRLIRLEQLDNITLGNAQGADTLASYAGAVSLLFKKICGIYMLACYHMIL